MSDENRDKGRRSSPPEARSAVLVVVLVALLLAGLATAGATSDPDGASGSPSPSASSSTLDASSPTPDEGITPSGGGGGNINNEVVVVNTTDGRFANRSGFGVARVTGDTAENQNAAAATSSCIDCRTVAVAAQIVLIQRTDASVISPRNIALALNIECVRCETFAAAYQYVITTDGLVRFTPEGQQRLANLQTQIRDLTATDGIAFPDLEAQIDALVEQMWSVVDNELVKVGRNVNARSYKNTDEAVDGGEVSPDPTPSPDDSASPEPTESTDPEQTASSTPSSTSSPEPSPSSSPEPSPSSSPEPSPSQSP